MRGRQHRALSTLYSSRAHGLLHQRRAPHLARAADAPHAARIAHEQRAVRLVDRQCGARRKVEARLAECVAVRVPLLTGLTGKRLRASSNACLTYPNALYA